MTSYDVEKWKKKFFLVFTRERGTLDLSQNPSAVLDIKNITLNPKATTRVGERILKANVKFWIIYVQVVAGRLNDFAKSILRARLLGNDDGAPGLFSSSKQDFDLIVKEVGAIIEAEKLLLSKVNESTTGGVDDEILPVFGCATSK